MFGKEEASRNSLTCNTLCAPNPQTCEIACLFRERCGRNRWAAIESSSFQADVRCPPDQKARETLFLVREAVIIQEFQDLPFIHPTHIPKQTDSGVLTQMMQRPVCAQWRISTSEVMRVTSLRNTNHRIWRICLINSMRGAYPNATQRVWQYPLKAGLPMSPIRRPILLKEDHDALVATLEQLRNEYKRWGKSSTEVGGVGDWHDNFAYEEAMRQMSMLSHRIHELDELLHSADVVDPSELPRTPSRVSIGTKVTVLDDQGRERRYYIGGHTTLRMNAAVDRFMIVSYLSPIGANLVGKHTGDEVTITVANKRTTLLIQAIE